MLRCNQRMKFSGKESLGRKKEDVEKGGKRRGKREKGKGCFFGGVMKKVKGLGLS